MRTPRPVTTSRRGIGTLIGNGWLRESPRNLWPKEWDVRGRSALRKCMFLPLPQGMKHGLPAEPARVSPAAMAPVPKAPEPVGPRSRNPEKDVRMMPAVSPDAMRHALYAAEKAKLLGRVAEKRAWYEDPIALGSLLIMCPPIGLAALWSSKRYSNDARWALTIMTALTLCLGAAVAIALVALRA